MNRLDIHARDKVRERFARNPLFLLIKDYSLPLMQPPHVLQLRPEEVFQMVMGWIDFIRCEPDDDRVADRMREAWDRLWADFCDMAERSSRDCPAGEVEEYVCLVLGLLHNCLAKLSDEECCGNLLYFRFGDILFTSAFSHSVLWMKTLGGISRHQAYARYSPQVKDWLLGYMASDDVPYTDVEGRLVLQEDWMVVSPPPTEHDGKLYGKKAQEIWKKLLEKGWCEKSGSVLVWRKSNRALGYMVKLVAHELNVLDPSTGNISWKSFFHLWMDLNDSKILEQAKRGAGEFKLNAMKTGWPADAQELKNWMKSI